MKKFLFKKIFQFGIVSFCFSVVFATTICAEAADFPKKKLELMYTEGAWGWSEDITIRNGKISGYYHELNTGESGNGYDDTIYYCNFSGKFKDIKKLSKKKYIMKCGKINISNAKDYVENRVHYIPYSADAASTYISMRKNNVFVLYCPGYAISKLPEEAKFNLQMVYGIDPSQKQLDRYVLFNKSQGITFSNFPK